MSETLYTVPTQLIFKRWEKTVVSTPGEKGFQKKLLVKNTSGCSQRFLVSAPVTEMFRLQFDVAGKDGVVVPTGDGLCEGFACTLKAKGSLAFTLHFSPPPAGSSISRALKPTANNLQDLIVVFARSLQLTVPVLAIAQEDSAPPSSFVPEKIRRPPCPPLSFFTANSAQQTTVQTTEDKWIDSQLAQDFARSGLVGMTVVRPDSAGGSGSGGESRGSSRGSRSGANSRGTSAGGGLEEVQQGRWRKGRNPDTYSPDAKSSSSSSNSRGGSSAISRSSGRSGRSKDTTGGGDEEKRNSGEKSKGKSSSSSKRNTTPPCNTTPSQTKVARPTTPSHYTPYSSAAPPRPFTPSREGREQQRPSTPSQRHLLSVVDKQFVSKMEVEIDSILEEDYDLEQEELREDATTTSSSSSSGANMIKSSSNSSSSSTTSSSEVFISPAAMVSGDAAADDIDEKAFYLAFIKKDRESKKS